jgi:flagellar biosynthesis protein FlhF
MKIKRYEGPEMDLPKLMHQVKQDLGDNAIIKTQTFKKGGFLGVGGQRWVRILAGVEESSSHNGRDSSESRMHFDPPRKLTDQELKPERPITVNFDDSPALKGILQELKTLKESINEIKSRDDEVKEQRKSVEADLPGWFEYLRKILIKSGMDREVARALSEGVIEITPPEDKDDFDRIKRHFVDYVVSMIVKPSESLSGRTKANDRRVIILIGPTGVGKTTTLAKLAANYALLEDKSVCLITADTYRIAAIDQLRTFAQIINLPLDVVFSPFELKKAVESQKDKDVILVDTAGRSPLDEEKMTELAELLRQEIGAEVHLVLSATTKTGDLKAITEKFKTAGFDKLILSKIDETVTYGPLLEYLIEETPPLSYLTNGQNVPDDIIFAQERDLVELIAKRALEGGSQVV